MGRWGGYGRRTVEQTRSVDINELRRGGYVGKPLGNWWVARNNLFQRGFTPRHWNDNAITLDAQNAAHHLFALAIRRSAGLFSL